MGPRTPPTADSGARRPLTFDTPDPITVGIDLPVGHVRIIAGDRHDTVVAVLPTDSSRRHDVEAAQRTQIAYTAGRLSVKVPKPRGLAVGMGRYGSVDLTIEVPAGSGVEATAGFTDFAAHGRLGDVRIETGAGDLRLEQAGRIRLASNAGAVSVEHAVGEAEVTTAGDLQLGNVDGPLQIKNLNGRTLVGDVTGDLQVKSANGDITVDRAAAAVNASTANGSIRVGAIVTGFISLTTSSGTIEVGVSKGTTAWVDAASRFGRIHNMLAAADEPDTSVRTAEVYARTSFGDVVVRRA